MQGLYLLERGLFREEFDREFITDDEVLDFHKELKYLPSVGQGNFNRFIQLKH